MMKDIQHINTVYDIFEQKNYSYATINDALKEKCIKADCLKDLDQVSLCIDDEGYFVRTHRARSSSYKKPEDIPISKIKFVASTS